MKRCDAIDVAEPDRARRRLTLRRDINCNTIKGNFEMSGQYRKTRTFGAVVIAMSLISNSVSAASTQALTSFRPALTFTTTTDDGHLVQVQHRRGDGARDRDDRFNDRRDRKRWDRRGERRGERRAERREERRADRRAERREDQRYRNGHRGYRDQRPGYRRDNDGWWFPLAAFALGAVILNQQQKRTPSYSQSYTPSYDTWNHIPSRNMAAHDNWCDQQYRSYSRSTKTFQPYNGPRKYCNSPFDLL